MDEGQKEKRSQGEGRPGLRRAEEDIDRCINQSVVRFEV